MYHVEKGALQGLKELLGKDVNGRPRSLLCSVKTITLLFLGKQEQGGMSVTPPVVVHSYHMGKGQTPERGSSARNLCGVQAMGHLCNFGTKRKVIFVGIATGSYRTGMGMSPNSTDVAHRRSLKP